MAEGKSDGPKPKLRDKMAAAFVKMRNESRRAISREPAPKGDCGCGCK